MQKTDQKSFVILFIKSFTEDVQPTTTQKRGPFEQAKSNLQIANVEFVFDLIEFVLVTKKEKK